MGSIMGTASLGGAPDEYRRFIDPVDAVRRLDHHQPSWLLRFVDDVDAVVDPDAGVIHVRSASRVGYSDLGVNRKRVEAIRAAFANAR